MKTIFCFVLIFALYTTTTLACSCLPPKLMDQRIQEAEVVFRGEVVKKCVTQTTITYSVDIVENCKNGGLQTWELTTARQSATCGVSHLQVGDIELFFVSPETNTSFKGHINSCNHGGDVAYSSISQYCPDPAFIACSVEQPDKTACQLGCPDNHSCKQVSKQCDATKWIRTKYECVADEPQCHILKDDKYNCGNDCQDLEGYACLHQNTVCEGKFKVRKFNCAIPQNPCDGNSCTADERCVPNDRCREGENCQRYTCVLSNPTPPCSVERHDRSACGTQQDCSHLGNNYECTALRTQCVGSKFKLIKYGCVRSNVQSSPCDRNDCANTEVCVPHDRCLTSKLANCKPYDCVNERCYQNDCAQDETCVPHPAHINCVPDSRTGTCKPYTCVKTVTPKQACENNNCNPRTQICVPKRKWCFTTPCPQYECQPNPCLSGQALCPSNERCVADVDLECEGDKCRHYKCEPVVFDACANNNCKSYQKCRPRQTPCPINARCAPWECVNDFGLLVAEIKEKRARVLRQ